MNNRYTNICELFILPRQFAVRLLAVLAFLAVVIPVSALDPDTYAASSRLSSGRWVRVAVSATGMHCIPEASLRSWGFSNPSAVRVYGYGADRLPELLDSSYRDDLAQTPSEYVAGKGVFFYAFGPDSWSMSTAGYYIPVVNPFTLQGYYFLTEDGAPDDSERLEPPTREFVNVTGPGYSTFYDRQYHKRELISPGEAGFLLLGEDFRIQNTQSFDFTLADFAPCPKRMVTEEQEDGTLVTKEVEDPNVNIEFAFVAKTLAENSRVSFTANGSALEYSANDVIGKSGEYAHGIQLTSRKQYKATGERLSLGVSYRSTGTLMLANLNYIAVTYLRKMQMPAARRLTVYMQARGNARLAGATDQTRVWDVSDGADIRRMDTRVVADSLQWGVQATERTYVAWEPSGTFPAPVYVEQVKAQNLHALPVPDMIIFTPDEWKSEAERLADFHRQDPLRPLQVLVLTPQAIYNEFASGSPDVQAFRKCMKMFYDRSASAPEGEGKLRYALFMSRLTFDPRRITAAVKAMNYPMLPAWFTDRGLHDNDSYTSDDMIAFLEDGSGVNTSRDKLSVALGRLPVTSLSDAKAAVDKIIAYTNNSPQGLWRNNIVMLADDKNSGQHMIQSDNMWKAMVATNKEVSGAGAIYKKIYIDAYELVSNTFPEARAELYRSLDEGAMLWTFVGHANPASLTAEGLVTYTDLNNLYLRHWPLVYFATCDFMRWDSSTMSGAEILFKNANGGVISAISATRPVYIGDNGLLTESLGYQFFRRDPDGLQRTVGEIYQATKNLFQNPTGTGAVKSNSNKLRFVLLADPAMRLVYPSNTIQLQMVGDSPVIPADSDEGTPVQLMARQNTTFSGVVTDAAGNPLTDFNGTVSLTLYDADMSVTSNGYSADKDPGLKYTFDKIGGRLYVGSGPVRDGKFEVTVSMPAEVADNYRQATLNMYAVAEDGRDANGVCRDLYVYGTDPSATPDDNPPVIEEFYLNHPTFADGGRVNSAPMVIATVTDDRAINLSTAGVGHQMVLYLDDGAKSYTDVADYFTPFADGEPGGVIRYPLSDIPEGPHSVRLRVWDTAPNSTEATLSFNVAKDIVPNIYEVYTDRNPVSESANFFISHDRPDQMLTVTVEVFDLMGRRVWEKTQTARSDMFVSSPVTWDLIDNGGRRVSRGIYVYRATVSDSDSGEKTATSSRKLAVTAP